jgi:two-component system sensor histidine kinase QseC
VIRSLQGRLLALVLGAVLVVWASAAALTWSDARHELDELLDSHLAQAAALLVVQQSSEPEFDDDRAVDAPQLHLYAPRVAFQVWHEGALTMRSSNAPTAPMIRLPARQQQDGFATVSIGGLDWRVFATRGGASDVMVFVGEQAESRADILRALLRGTLAPMALALPLLALAVWWAVRRGTMPLRRLSGLLAGRAPQALEPVALEAAPSEMEPMIAALNGLLARIGAMVESERRFTADAAHELRTPIAAIRAQAQVALAESDSGERAHALEFTLRGCDRATRLVEQLLTLSRLESGEAPPLAPVDLAALARRVAGEIAPAALARHQALSLAADTPCPVRGDETLLAVLLRNLLDNAVRYSPAGAEIAVAVRCEAGRALLNVEDGGAGLADADLRRLGDRFFRVLGSGESGSGLGWSIVRRIADAHAARVEPGRSLALGGLAVSVSFLPAERAPEGPAQPRTNTVTSGSSPS